MIRPSHKKVVSVSFLCSPGNIYYIILLGALSCRWTLSGAYFVEVLAHNMTMVMDFYKVSRVIPYVITFQHLILVSDTIEW